MHHRVSRRRERLTLEVVHGDEEADRGSKLGKGEREELRVLEDLELRKEANNAGRLGLLRKLLAHLVEFEVGDLAAGLRHLLATLAFDNQETGGTANVQSRGIGIRIVKK